MKKLCLLVLSLPMFGCSHFDEEVYKSSNPVQPLVSTTRGEQQSEEPFKQKNIPNSFIEPNQSMIGVKTINSSKLIQAASKKTSCLLNVALMRQNPELGNGCEVKGSKL